MGDQRVLGTDTLLEAGLAGLASLDGTRKGDRRADSGRGALGAGTGRLVCWLGEDGARMGERIFFLG